MIEALEVAGAGGLGAVARHSLDARVRHHRTRRASGVGDLDGILVVNVVGSLLLGVLTGATLWHAAPAAWRTVGGIGFCGGFTTWSTATWEIAAMVAEGRRRVAWRAGVAGIAGPLGAAATGLVLARWL